MSVDNEADRQVDAESITSLRGEGPRVVRLSRKTIGITSAAALALIGGALVYALQPPSQQTAAEQINTESVAMADSLASAPRDYSEVPRLGPPLPGDLGKPILDAQDRGAVAELPPIGSHSAPPPQATNPRELARQRLAQEREAARQSRLFFGGGASIASGIETSEASLSRALGDTPSNRARQQSRLDESSGRRTASPQRLEAPSSPTLLQAGSIIPAALITGIRSDQPGLVTAQVTEGRTAARRVRNRCRLRSAPGLACVEPADPARRAVARS
jgi:type IV secretory pathway VirB10-like protein